MEKFKYSTEVELEGKYDVIVAGAGPAGICAAVAAARRGAKVALLERYGVVGGNLSVGYVGPVLGMVCKGTMRDEIVKILDIPENDMLGYVGKAHDFEKAKLSLAEFVNHENIDVYLQTAVFDTLMDGNRVTGVVLATNQGKLALEGKVVIDCTGDGIVATVAGADVRKGREDGLMQPVTLEFTIEGVDENKGVTCIGDVDDVELNGERFLDFCKRRADAGRIPAHLAAVRLHPVVEKGQRQVNTTQANKVDMTHIREIFPADLELRRQIETLMGFFREELPGYENVKVLRSGATTGVRETRRVMGDYLLTAEDLVAGKQFEDAVVHEAEFIVDIHNPEGAGQAEDKIAYVIPYDIPYRAMLPKGIEGLLVAGRCISGTHRAHASYRVMSICMAMGEAAGTAAALAAKENITPRQLPASEVRASLKEAGVQL